MATSPLLVLDGDTCPKLQMEKRVKNVFVTQLEDTRDRKKEMFYIPAMETPSKLLMPGLKTLKKTLISRKQAELHDVEVLLALKTQDFRRCMEALAHRRSELQIKQQQAKEKELKFERFVAENEVKRRKVLKQCQATLEQNLLKQRELEDLTEQLKKLEARRQVLKQRTEKYKIYEDYLMKTLDHLPSIYHHSSYESLVTPIIRRHETLSITYQELLQRLRHLEVEVEKGQRQLQSMKQQCSIKKLMSNKELSELQSELESLKEKNKQAEVNLLMKQDISRDKVEEVGKLLMAVNNLAQQCYLPEFGPLESMSVLTMMDMVKEFILDKADTERRVRRLEFCSTTALTDKRWRESLKSIGSKTQIKSSTTRLQAFMQMEVCSLVSRKEDISSLLPEETSPKYKDLGRQFSAVRKVCGDGNCFYRAVCFAHLESVLHSPRALQRFKDQVLQSGDVLVSAGFDETSFSHHQSTVSLTLHSV
ncbi:hypothetical protein CHARACLAT_026133 [Characodon lateralis]|uniref:OTU domain-containing protein n=1 Tax=Characodon lateralis TaxID=208331 RepID=A0ABU7DJY0_9TELE|nr:hypothetical protein [Characodon lateralis]